MNIISTLGFHDAENEKLRDRFRNELRAEIKTGLEAYNRGDYAPLDIEALRKDLREIVQSKKRKGERG